jgi:hypothetical protein
MKLMRHILMASACLALGGCATDMITQCTMKSVSGDHMYAAVVAGGAVLIKEAVDRNAQSEPAEPLAEPSSK